MLRTILCYFILFDGHVHAARLLEIINHDPQLSAFSSLITGTGGHIPNPDLQDRFNNPNSGINFTVFAPTNNAFSRVQSSVLRQLSNPQNYPLLLSIIRTHFVEGNHNTKAFKDADKTRTLKSVEGYDIALLSDDEGEYIYQEHAKDRRYASIVAGGTVIAENGIVHKIDRILDPFSSAFGIATFLGDITPTLVDKSPRQDNKTMTDLVLSEPRLSRWTELIQEVLPAILKRLGDRRGPEGVACTTPHPFAMLPSNNAFSAILPNYTEVLKAPFNFALSSHLLAWGISIPNCFSFEDIMRIIHRDGEFHVFSHRADINLTIKETPRGSGQLTVNNAQVEQANSCAGNGCIWLVNRMVDPIYGVF